ncbi:Peptidase C48, SUMO/Sentrin/Ubl1 [Niveomyces insectorum RCEF 264]|uniref:Peptidase C48, SUMO/Sentrin/Ubl1 n=1 Tax=Niveomyces insectorum RCEF 264 TaxID=1081102 RepID=A0A167XB70_9HYPO|nr:Peptidase C48, SUMO/Sentrin/Ubl1 [Niveomyces insectorum RCEF 264]
MVSAYLQVLEREHFFLTTLSDGESIQWSAPTAADLKYIFVLACEDANWYTIVVSCAAKRIVVFDHLARYHFPVLDILTKHLLSLRIEDCTHFWTTPIQNDIEDSSIFVLSFAESMLDRLESSDECLQAGCGMFLDTDPTISPCHYNLYTAQTDFEIEFSPHHLDKCIQAWRGTHASLVSLGAMDILIDNYQKRQTSAINRVLARVSEQLERPCRARLKKDLMLYDNIIGRTVTGTAVSAAQFLDLQTGDFLICSHAEVVQILATRPLRVPIFIPKTLSGYNNDWGVPKESLEDYLELLRTYATLDAHYLDVDDVNCQPLSKRACDVIDDFQKGDKGPINLLNLQGPAKSPPRCILGPRFSILETVYENYQAGKRLQTLHHDLSASSRFNILGSAGSFSLPHIDHHGVITSVFCEKGEKLWILWPNLGVEDVKKWAETDSDPESAPVGIFLEEGDLLLQPAGTIHAPTSVTDCWMTGTMHWDARDLVTSMRLTELELRYRHTTNEDPAKEFRGKIDTIEALWRGKQGPWPWPEEGVEEFSRLLQSIRGLLAKKRRHRK